MKFEYLSEDEVKMLLPLIPDDVMEGDLKIISVSEEEGLRGFAVVEIESDDHVRLKWLYVLEKYRQQGYAGAMVKYLADILHENKECVLSSFYEANSDEATILDAIFTHNNFEIENEDFVICQATRDQILGAPVMGGITSAEDIPEGKGDIYPLEDVALNILDDFIARNPDFAAADDEIIRSNGILSLAFGVNGKMTGLLLVQDTDQPGEYVISNLYYNDSDNPDLIIEFFQKAMAYIVLADDLVQELEFIAITDMQRKLLTKFLGENIEWVSTLMSTALLVS